MQGHHVEICKTSKVIRTEYRMVAELMDNWEPTVALYAEDGILLSWQFLQIGDRLKYEGLDVRAQQKIDLFLMDQKHIKK